MVMRRAAVSTLAVFAGLLLLSIGTLADVVYRVGGGKLVGTIVEQDEDTVTIRTRVGLVTVDRDDIDRIDLGPVEEEKRDASVAEEPADPSATEGDTTAGAGVARPRRKPAATAPAAASGIPTLKGLLAEVRSADRARREKAMQQLTETAVGRNALREEFESQLAQVERALKQWFRARQATIRTQLVELVRVRRKEALSFIMDPAKYPEENHGEEAQPEVDRLVGLLERAYKHPFDELRELSAEVRRLAAEAERIGAEARRILAQEAGPAGEGKRLARIRAEVNKRMALTGLPLDEREQRGVELSQETLRFNAALKIDIGKEERGCAAATNRYRMMFGLRALRIDERLLRAARGHSKDMVDHGFFDHTSPVPGKQTPEQRCALTGATFSGENIALGSTTGEDTFDQWYRSSGHHRNMLGRDHLSIAIGRHQNHWTQLFGLDQVR
ncbi:CAP domain-containing protein [Planctomycetota bacterium]